MRQWIKKIIEINQIERFDEQSLILELSRVLPILLIRTLKFIYFVSASRLSVLRAFMFSVTHSSVSLRKC